MTLVQEDHQQQHRENFCGNLDSEDCRTSDVYETENLPYRFEHPSRWNYGNCVFTPSEAVVKDYTTGSHGKRQLTEYKAIGHPFFQTTNSQYGSKPPCIHTVPHTFHPRNHKFWEHLSSVGMYRNCSFNTGIDKSVI